MPPHRPWRTVPGSGPLRSFALGGLVGAAGAVATLRRIRRAPGTGAFGLAAFEDAPCFRELAESEAQEPDAAGDDG